jgi:hypothetical protein
MPGDVRYHSTDDMDGLGELKEISQPVAVVIRKDGSLDVYGYVGIVDQRRPPDLPLPGDEYDGRQVIASCYCGFNEDVGQLVLLNEQMPFYSVVEVDLPSLRSLCERSFTNISLAVTDYEGGVV